MATFTSDIENREMGKKCRRISGDTFFSHRSPLNKSRQGQPEQGLSDLPVATVATSGDGAIRCLSPLFPSGSEQRGISARADETGEG